MRAEGQGRLIARWPSSRTIFVAGAGIGGLTASLALAAQGFRVVVLEKAERLEEAGAGLQLSPNASRVLIDLGLQPRLAARAVTPEAISIMSARAGGEIVRLPLGEAATLARRRALLGGASRRSAGGAAGRRSTTIPISICGSAASSRTSPRHAKGLTVVQRSGTTRQQELALALIGADGIWSTVRHHLFPEVQPQFSGLIAWRGTLDATQLPREYTSRRVQLWMGPNAHLVAYPISGARQINVVAVVPGTWNRPGWSAPGDANEIKNAFASSRWPGTARMMIGAVDDWRKWALFTVPDGGEWTEGAIALLGDAAHAMLPFAAQGAGMAIEDAAVLAKCLGEAPATPRPGIPAALKRYARLRRAARGAGAAHRAAVGTHLSPDRRRWRMARDLAIRAMGAKAHAGAAGLDLRLAGVNDAATARRSMR